MPAWRDWGIAACARHAPGASTAQSGGQTRQSAARAKSTEPLQRDVPNDYPASYTLQAEADDKI